MTTDSCRHCGFSVPVDAAQCPGCRRPAIDDWKRLAKGLDRRPRRGRPANELREEGYRSLVTRARLARAAFSLTAATALTAGIIFAARPWLPEERREVFGALRDRDDLVVVAGAAVVGAAALAMILFVLWAVRAYRNLPALRIAERRFWTIWIVLGWFVPGINLIIPKLLVDDLWRASSPCATYRGTASWHRRPVASVVHRWWLLWLLAPATLCTGIVTLTGRLDGLEAHTALSAVVVASAVVLVGSTAAGRTVVGVVTVAQARRADVVVDIRAGERNADDVDQGRPSGTEVLRSGQRRVADR